MTDFDQVAAAAQLRQAIIDDAPKLFAENQRLRAEVAALNQPVRLSEWQELVAERDLLRARLHEVKEIYAGMDGFIPQTAPESYLQRIVKQMYQAAVGGDDE